MSEQFRILDLNYAFKSDVHILPTSENANFPAENLRNFFRSSVWRSEGNFKITASNNKIDFKEASLGPQLTATIPIASYTIAELIAEIKFQMELVGTPGSYTVEFLQGSGTWKITSALAFFSLLFLTGTNTAATIAPAIGFNVADQTGALFYEGNHIACHTEEALVFDMGVTTGIDSFALIFDKAVPPKFTDNAVLRLQASHTNAWNTPAVDVALAIDFTYSCALKFFSSLQNYRYWRLKLVDPENPYLYVEVPKVFIASATNLTQTPEMGFSRDLTDGTKVTKTPYGHAYADLYPIARQQTFDYKFLSDADAKELERIFETVGTSTPICVCLDPTEVLFAKERFFMYGRIKGANKQKQRYLANFDVPLVIEEAI